MVAAAKLVATGCTSTVAVGVIIGGFEQKQQNEIPI